MRPDIDPLNNENYLKAGAPESLISQRFARVPVVIRCTRPFYGQNSWLRCTISISLSRLHPEDAF